MCMLTFFTPGQQPNAEALFNGTMVNQDGHGYAIVIPGRRPRMLVRHSMNPDTIIERFMADRERFADGPALFHSRWGTSGIYGKYNCHPFYMGGDKRTVVAHNGVLPQHMLPNRKDARCDTRKAAEQRFTVNYGHLSQPRARQDLAEDIGRGNKLVILTVDPAYDSSSYIINEKAGTWEGGIWYSNSDYLGYSKPVFVWDDDEDDYLDSLTGDCPFCKSKNSVDMEYQYCEMCSTCMDCYENLSECVCYLPATAHLFSSKESA